jgi:TonB family protein
VETLDDEITVTTPFPRIQVAEAPQGRVLYPVSPDPKLIGKVRLKVLIAASGKVKQVRVLSGKPQLAEAAQHAVRYWKYQHHELNGQPAEAETDVTVSFLGQDAVSLRFPSGVQNGSLKMK